MSKKPVNKRRVSLCLRLEHNVKRSHTYFSNAHENLRSSCVVNFLNIQLFHMYFWSILLKCSRILTKRSTPFSEIYGYFRKVVMLLVKNTTSNKSFDVKNKEDNKVIWHRCWSLSLWTWSNQSLLKGEAISVSTIY